LCDALETLRHCQQIARPDLRQTFGDIGKEFCLGKQWPVDLTAASDRPHPPSTVTQRQMINE